MKPKLYAMSQIEFSVFPIFLVLLVLAVSATQTHATPDAIVKVDPSTNFANVGDMFSVNVIVINVQNLYGLEVTLSWNSTVLQAESADGRMGQPDGVLFNPVSIVRNSTQQGTYALSATSTSPAPPFSGNGTIVRMTFRVLNPGTSGLSLNSQLADYPPPDRDPRQSWLIAHTTIDGTFSTAIPEIPSVLIPLLAVLVTVFAVVISKIFVKTCHNVGEPRSFGVKGNLFVEGEASE